MKGIYVLIIEVEADILLEIGSLGKLGFKKGLYVYVGSAQNSLEGRIERHLRKEKRLFWHIDHLLNSEFARIIEVFYKQGKKTEECLVAKRIGKTSKAINNFGSSDCECPSHLCQIEDYQFLQEFMSLWNLESTRLFRRKTRRIR